MDPDNTLEFIGPVPTALRYAEQHLRATIAGNPVSSHVDPMIVRATTILALALLVIGCVQPSQTSATTVFPVTLPTGADKGQADIRDEWRYVPAASGRGAAAELGEMEVYGFRIQCIPTRHELSFEYFPGDGGPGDWAEEARNSGIDLILYYPPSDTETIFEVHGPVTGNSLTGTLPLTADFSDEIAEAPRIMLYGENGPSNVTFGGEATAVRRVVRECAPPRTGPRPPRVEQGREKSEW